MQTLVANLTAFLKSLPLPRLVDIYNLANPKAQIKKFENRVKGETRILTLMTTWGESGKPAEGEVSPVISYNNFFTDFAVFCAKGKDGFQLPAPEPIPSAKVRKNGEDGEKKQSIPPFLNLRCPVCDFFAKVSAPSHAKGRLVCPIDGGKHGILKTAEERGEKRGRF